MNRQPATAGYILRVWHQGRRLRLELVDLRSGDRQRLASLGALWRALRQLLRATPPGLR